MNSRLLSVQSAASLRSLFLRFEADSFAWAQVGSLRCNKSFTGSDKHACRGEL